MVMGDQYAWGGRRARVAPFAATVPLTFQADAINGRDEEDHAGLLARNINGLSIARAQYPIYRHIIVRGDRYQRVWAFTTIIFSRPAILDR